MNSELIDKIAIAELDPKKRYIIEVDSHMTVEQVRRIRELFTEKLGITNIVIYRKGDLTITEVKDND